MRLLCVCCRCLQPIPEVYNLFDQVLLLQESYLVYSGPRESACLCLCIPSLPPCPFFFLFTLGAGVVYQEPFVCCFCHSLCVSRVCVCLHACAPNVQT